MKFYEKYLRKFVLYDINNKMIGGEELRLTFVCDFKLNEIQEKIIKEIKCIVVKYIIHLIMQ